MSSRRQEFDAVLLRADNYIQKQMHKLEQKRARQDATAGRGYGQIPSSREQRYGGPVPPPCDRREAQGPLASSAWTQEFDPQSRRWYYIEQATGRSQREPPSFSQQPPRQMLSHSQRAETLGDEQLARRLQEEEDSCARRLDRPNSQLLDPTNRSEYLDVGRVHARKSGISVSPHASPHGRLPPGTHLDMRTGQIVTNMYPPNYPANT
ncbi:Nn.00g015100.m01.CDS01 [Neocucurbitaria sp. VM-36]